MKKKTYTLEDIKKNTTKVERFEDESIYIDEFGNTHDINEDIEQAEKDIEKLKSAHVHFRWSKKEIERCKRIAAKLGIPYQTYIKMILKQALDRDDAA